MAKKRVRRAVRKKAKNTFIETLGVLRQLFNEIGKPTEPHHNKLKPIAQELLNCSEFLILNHKDNPVINRNYKILKKIEDCEYKACKAGFEVRSDEGAVCYNLNDAKKYHDYLRKKFRKFFRNAEKQGKEGQPKVAAIQEPKK